MWHAWERRENCTRFWLEIMKERDHSEDVGVDERIKFKWIIRKLGWRV